MLTLGHVSPQWTLVHLFSPASFPNSLAFCLTKKTRFPESLLNLFLWGLGKINWIIVLCLYFCQLVCKNLLNVATGTNSTFFLSGLCLVLLQTCIPVHPALPNHSRQDGPSEDSPGCRLQLMGLVTQRVCWSPMSLPGSRCRTWLLAITPLPHVPPHGALGTALWAWLGCGVSPFCYRLSPPALQAEHFSSISSDFASVKYRPYKCFTWVNHPVLVSVNSSLVPWK